MLLALAACSSDRPEAGTDVGMDAQAGAQADSAEVWVEDFGYSLLPGGGRVLTGTFVNATGAEIRNAQVQVSLFDGDNRLASTMHIPVQNIGPGERKPFREPLDTDLDIRSARVRSILFM